MGDWLWVCNVADAVPFIDAFRRMADSTVLIRLMYARTQYPMHINAVRAKQVPGKKQKA